MHHFYTKIQKSEEKSTRRGECFEQLVAGDFVTYFTSLKRNRQWDDDQTVEFAGHRYLDPIADMQQFRENETILKCKDKSVLKCKEISSMTLEEFLKNCETIPNASQIRDCYVGFRRRRNEMRTSINDIRRGGGTLEEKLKRLYDVISKEKY